MVIYLSGKITGEKDPLKQFEDYEKALKRVYPKCEVINPAKISTYLPTSFKHDDYMDIDLELIKKSDAVFFMRGWENSPGALQERWFSLKIGKKIIEDR